MDLSPQQVQEIQEIEKQIGSDTSSPKVISQTEDKSKSVLVNLLVALGISVAATGAVILLMVIPFAKKKVATAPLVSTGTVQISSPNIVVQAEYVNPFSADAQYQNPFTVSQNPFSNLTQ